MAVEQINLELIQDNPYQARSAYHKKDINDLAHSIEIHGLLQVPPGRRIDGNVELGFGHLRKRAFAKLAKKEPEKWGKMPIDIRELTDEQMALFVLEENLKRHDISPMDVARSVDNFLNSFLEKTEVEMAEYLNMTKGNVSNMRRVLRLPEKFLEKIDAGVISFTQGRELLTLEGLENAENLMSSALGGLRTGNKAYGHSNTVEGLQASIHGVISGHYCPLDKEWEGYRWNLLFDTREAGCLKCDKMIRTHPNKSQAAHYCTDGECWDRHDKEHREKAAAAAKAQMEADILKRTAEKAPVMIDENTICVDQETFSKLEASNSCERISKGTAVRKPVEYEGKLYVATSSGMGKVEAYQLVPRGEFTGEVRTYKVPKGREYDEYYESLRNDPNGFYHGMLVKRGKGECVLVGPEVTFVTKVDKGDISQESLEEQADEMESQLGVCREKANLERPVGELPCETCLRGKTCDRSFFHIADDNSGRLVCDTWQPEGSLEQDVSQRIASAPAPPQAVPEDLLEKAKAAAGTRAEVLDLRPLYADDWRHELKGGFVNLSECIDQMDDPAECLERCTQGFHYAFDSKFIDRAPGAVCTDPKCVSKKKATLTRKRNAAGQARKKAEVKAVKEAIAQTTTLDRPRIKLIFLVQMDGRHTQRSYYGGGDGKNPETWLWERLSAGTPAIARKREDLFKRIDKLTDEELAKLVVEFMFYYLTDKGDIGTYEIKAAEPLNWMGIAISTDGDEGHD